MWGMKKNVARHVPTLTNNSKKIMRNFFRVKSQSDTFFVQSQKAEGGQVSMCNVVLQELGGKFETVT